MFRVTKKTSFFVFTGLYYQKYPVLPEFGTFFVKASGSSFMYCLSVGYPGIRVRTGIDSSTL